MKYDHTDCASGCLITDGTELLYEVVCVDTDARTITQCEIPLRAVGDDDFATISRTFERAEVTCDAFGMAVFISLHGLQP